MNNKTNTGRSSPNVSMFRAKVMRSRPYMFLRYLSGRAGFRYVKLVQYEKEVRGPEGPEPSCSPGSLRNVTLSDLEDIRVLDGLIPPSTGRKLKKRFWKSKYDQQHEQRTKEIVDRLQAGEICLLLSSEGEACGYLWLLSNGKRYHNLIQEDVVAKEDEAILYSLYVHPQYRRHGCGRKLINCSVYHLAKNTKVMLLRAYVESDNLMSRKAFLYAGFEERKVIKHVRIFSYNKTQSYDIVQSKE